MAMSSLSFQLLPLHPWLASLAFLTRDSAPTPLSEDCVTRVSYGRGSISLRQVQGRNLCAIMTTVSSSFSSMALKTPLSLPFLSMCSPLSWLDFCVPAGCPRTPSCYPWTPTLESLHPAMFFLHLSTCQGQNSALSNCLHLYSYNLLWKHTHACTRARTRYAN